MADEKEALQEFLRSLIDNPWLADRIEITIRPAKILKGIETAEKAAANDDDVK